jgi:hypothetical protein
MCPACVASVALIAVGVVSTGGLTAFVAKKLHQNNVADEVRWLDSGSDKDPNTKSHTDGKEQL